MKTEKQLTKCKKSDFQYLGDHGGNMQKAFGEQTVIQQFIHLACIWETPGSNLGH
jgi:hypothetical protein